jgi:L-lactate dehydrogenase complex protein LldG
MTDSRSRILSSIRQSLAAARHLPEPNNALLPSLASVDSDSLAAQFRSELEKLGGIFLSERRDTAAARVAALVRERQAAQVAAWAPEHLPVPGLLEELSRAGMTVVDSQIPSEAPARSQRLSEVERVSVGITGVDAALADTGTLVLRSGAGRPRLASLSVRTHIALLTPEQLYASWEDWWANLSARGRWVSEASNVTLVSGPSRTADIEMTLTVGVHGPAEVMVIMVEP